MTAAVATSLNGVEPRHRWTGTLYRCQSHSPLKLFAVDEKLREHIAARSDKAPDFWAFSTKAEREDVHGYFQYPAMMVPRVQRELLRIIIGLQPNIRSILDPFAGSGTILSEGMYAGLEACMQDINPLAVLLCKTKAGPFLTDMARERATALQESVRADTSENIEADFPGINNPTASLPFGPPGRW